MFIDGKTIYFDSRPVITGSAGVVGKKEGEGPLGGDFDGCDGHFPAGIEGVQSIPAVRAAFARSFGENLAEKIFFGNAEAFIDRVL